MNDKCDVLINHEYDDIQTFDKYLVLINNYHSKFLYNPMTDEVLPVEFSDIESYNRKDGSILLKYKEGYILVRDGEVAHKSRYGYIASVYNSTDFIYRDSSGLMGILDQDFNIKIAAQYDHLDSYYGYITVIKDRKQGFLNQNYEVIVPIIYDNIDSKSGLITFVKNEKYHLFDKETGQIKPGQYDNVIDKNGNFLLTIGDSLILIDPFFNTVFREICDDIRLVGYDLYGVKRKGLWQICNRNGGLVTDEKFRYVAPIGDTNNNIFIMAQGKNNVELLNTTNGTFEKLKGEYYGLEVDFNEPGWVSLRANGIKPYFDYTSEYCLIRNSKTNKLGIANVLGELLLDPIYEEIQIPNYNNKGTYTLNGKSGILNYDLTLEPAIYDKLKYEYTIQGFRATLDGKEVVLDSSGKLLE